MATSKALTFETWIEGYGIRRLAGKLDIHYKTVHTWLRRSADPRVNQMRRIRKLSKGLITYEMMIDRRPITKTYRTN